MLDMSEWLSSSVKCRVDKIELLRKIWVPFPLRVFFRGSVPPLIQINVPTKRKEKKRADQRSYYRNLETEVGKRKLPHEMCDSSIVADMNHAKFDYGSSISHH